MSRRTVLRHGALLASGVAGASFVPGTASASGTSPAAAPAAAVAPAGSAGTTDQTIELTGTATGVGDYLYLPFQVPDGVNRISVSMRKSGDASIGIGLFDHRGPGYGSAGFRGIYGEEASAFTVAAHEASRAFRPGRIEPGTWTVVIPVFEAALPTTLTVAVTIGFGSQQPEAVPGPAQGVVRDKPGWYRGDLHNHTTHSSDAYSSGSALAPADYPAAMRRAGLDWVVFTDHNVTVSNDHLARDAGDSGVLLIGGVEMTNWFHGHATVTGMEPGDWLDWRQRPAAVPLREHERRIDAFFDDVRRRDVYVAAAHPAAAHLSWQFLAEGLVNPALLPDGLEVWNGPHQPDDDAALAAWDTLLKAGHRVFASGGSDLHGTADPATSALGAPTTVVYADTLSRRDVVAALRAGRSYVTATPAGPDLLLEANGPDGQHAMVGGTVEGAPTASVDFSVVVRGGAGRTLLLLRDGAPVRTTPITSDDQTVSLRQRVGLGGYVRAELRGTPELDPSDPANGRTGMAALTNPIFLVRQ